MRIDHERAVPPVVLVVLAVLSVLTLAALVGTANASPEPAALCSVCATEAFEEAGGERSATVAFSADGTAAWRAEVRITNESLAEEWRKRPPLTGRIGRTVEVTDDARLVVTYDERDAARPAVAGTFLSDQFHRPSSFIIANVHEFTVIAPDGYVVARAPGDATVNGTYATWTFDDPRIDQGHGPTFDDGRLVFAPEDATAPSVRAAGAVVAAVFVHPVSSIHPLYWTALYVGTGATLAVAHYGRQPDERLDLPSLAAVVLTTATVPVVVVAGLSGNVGPGGPPALPGLLTAAATGALAVVAGLTVGVVGLIGYAVAAGTPETGRW